MYSQDANFEAMVQNMAQKDIRLNLRYAGTADTN